MGFFSALFKQIFVLAAMLVLLPYFWWLSLGVDELTDISALDPGHFLISLGSFVVLESVCYVLLPLDMIPDCIPIIGKLDDGIAYLLMGGGILAGLLGVYITVGTPTN